MWGFLFIVCLGLGVYLMYASARARNDRGFFIRAGSGSLLLFAAAMIAVAHAKPDEKSDYTMPVIIQPPAPPADDIIPLFVN